MTVLLSSLYGSHLYGTATPESDVDIVNIVLPPLDSLLRGIEPKVVANIKEDTVLSGKRGNVDTKNVPVQIFVRDFLGGHAYALEVAFAFECESGPLDVPHPLFKELCKELRETFLTSDIQATTGFVHSQASVYKDLEERMLALKAVKNVLESFTFRGINANEQVKNYSGEFSFKARWLQEHHPGYIELIEPLSSLKVLGRHLPFTAPFKGMLSTVNSLLNKYEKRVEEGQSSIDWDSTMHARRVVDEMIKLFEGERVTFTYTTPHCQFLLNIKKGLADRDWTLATLDSRIQYLQHLQSVSVLPKRTPELTEKLETWLAGWMHRFYGLTVDTSIGVFPIDPVELRPRPHFDRRWEL